MNLIESIEFGILIALVGITMFNVVIPYSIRLFKLFPIGNKTTQKFNWKLHIDWTDNFLFGLVIVILFTFVFYFSPSPHEVPVSTQILPTILLFIGLNSYNFMFKPYIRSMVNDQYVENIDLKRWVNNRNNSNINLLIIKRNIINAYAIGILPFTKTILLSKSLLENMNEKR